MLNILHLSQTDINSDSRILKEMSAVSNAQRTVSGIGVASGISELRTESSSFDSKIDSIELVSRRFTILPEILKNILVVLEITFKMFRRAKKLNPRIIHCHDTPVLPLGLALKFATGARIIYDAHELESERNGLSKLAGKITLFVERKSWRYIDRLIVVSPSIQSWYNKKVGFKKSEIVLNAPVIDLQDNNEEYLRDMFSISKDSLIFIYNGIFTQGRGIELIIKVFRNTDIQSHIVFLGDGEMKGELLRVAKEHDNVHVHDSVPHESVVPITRSANVGLALVENISLSDYYCLPNKLFEYAFSGIHVLASNFPDISETVKKHNLGECCDVDFESLYNCVLKFEHEKPIRKPESSNLYALSWDAQKVTLNKLYSELIDEIEE